MLTLMGLLALGAAPVLTACGTSRESLPGGPVPVSAKKRIDVSLAAAPRSAEVVRGMSAFAARLHRETATATENYTVSPFSIAVAFGMLRAGARGDMARQIDEVFGFPTSTRPEGSPHETFNALTADLLTPSALKGGDRAPIVEVANGLFVDEDFGPMVKPAFADTLAEQYGARPETVDFSGDAIARLNAWTSQQTHGRISELFETLDPLTVLVLANAVYLKASWLTQFEPGVTSPQPFRTTAGSEVGVPMMSQETPPVRYAENAQWQRITLPYVGDELAMRVVLPRDVVTGVPALTSLLDVATASTGKDRPEVVALDLPRWDTATKLDLLAAVRSLGLTDLVDLRGITEEVDLELSQAVHRATITVDETGSEAAAVTGLGIRVLSAMPPPTITMRVDRPFVWAIVHEPSQTPVFVGHVVDPSTTR
jgi:serpin B